MQKVAHGLLDRSNLLLCQPGAIFPPAAITNAGSDLVSLPPASEAVKLVVQPSDIGSRKKVVEPYSAWSAISADATK